MSRITQLKGDTKDKKYAKYFRDTKTIIVTLHIKDRKNIFDTNYISGLQRIPMSFNISWVTKSLSHTKENRDTKDMKIIWNVKGLREFGEFGGI